MTGKTILMTTITKIMTGGMNEIMAGFCEMIELKWPITVMTEMLVNTEIITGVADIMTDMNKLMTGISERTDIMSGMAKN